MNLYGIDYSSLDLGFVDPSLHEYLSPSHEMMVDRRDREREVENLLKLSNSLLRSTNRATSPPKRRHDGTSPLPLGMDWSPPPRTWDGPNTTWPHDFHTGWSYCVTIPAWSTLSESEGSEPGVFYRVQVGLQSPEGVTTLREVLRRFSDFLKLSSDLKQSYRQKKLPPPPPKGLFKIKSETALEERRCSLEDWMTKMLSDIDFSRSVSVACFLELEAIARLSFLEATHDVPDINLSGNGNSSLDPVSNCSDACVPDDTSTVAALCGSTLEVSEFGSELHVNDNSSEFDNGVPVYVDYVSPSEATSNKALCGNDNSPLSEVSNEEGSQSHDLLSRSDSQFSHDTLVVRLKAKEQNACLIATEPQLATSSTDIEDLVARLNQKRIVRQYLTIKINDMETELESTKKSAKENLRQAISMEEERITQMQWDMEELRKRCMEMELRLKAEQDENCHDKVSKSSTNGDNETEEFESVREQLQNLQKCYEEAELKSKSEVKLLVKEVKSLRSSQSELRQELEKVVKERTDFETILQKERAERDHINAVNAKLLHECACLRSRLEEFSVDFLIDQENKLKMDNWPSSDVRNRFAAIDHLLAETQRLAQDNATTPVPSANNENADRATSDHELRKILIDVIIDNANLRKQANSFMQCAFNTVNGSPDSSQIVKEDTP